jgi:DNA-directed RNA polymerase specialized sigma24 family protein
MDGPTFEDFVAARGAALLRFALMLAGDRHHAEDLVQSVLTKAYVRWVRIAAMERPEAYLKRVLVNEHLRVVAPAVVERASPRRRAGPGGGG